MPKHVSPSQLRAIVQCEGYFHARYVGGLKEEGKSLALVVGIVIDRVLSEAVRRKIADPESQAFVDPDDVLCHWDEQLEDAMQSGEKWPMEPKFDAAGMSDKILQCCDVYLRDWGMQPWTSVQLEIKREGANPVLMYVDGVYRDDVGMRVPVDWKAKKRRDPLQFIDWLQASMYAHELGSTHCEVHYLVPYTKTVGFIVHRRRAIPERVISYYMGRRAELLKPGATPVLNPLSYVCNKRYCPGWDECLIGQAQSIATDSKAA